MSSETKYNVTKPSRAVVALNDEEGVVLWAVGAINDEILDDGNDADALGLLDRDKPDMGVWIWEGTFALTTDPFGTYSLPKGTFRKPTDVEWARITLNECPWQDALWLQTHLLKMC
jgi:hypothetical protein